MKTLRLAALAALAAGSLPCFATAPTWTQFSYGYYSTSGPPAIEYWVDVNDVDHDLVSLNTAGYNEVYNYWEYYGSNGDGGHRQSQGWGLSYMGEAAGQVWFSDSTASYYFQTTWEY